MDVNFLLDKCKEVCGVRTDGELAAALGVSKQALSSYRNGHRLPDPVQCATIAGLSGLPLAQVMGIVGEARAISREEKAVWRKLAATAALLAVVVLPALSERAHAAERASEGVTVGIMRNGVLRWVWVWLAWKLRPGKPSPGNLEAKLCA